MTPQSRRAIGRGGMKFALGQSVPRTEDPCLLTARGRYTDDFVLPRLAHAFVLRSPYAQARIPLDQHPGGAADAGHCLGS